MVRDSIEAKGDDAEGAPHTTTTTNGHGPRDATDAPNIMQVDGAADGQIATRSSTRSVAPSSTNRDSVIDGSADGDGVAEGEAQPGKRQRGGRRRAPDTPHRRLLELIDTISKYLCAYQEE